jgi:hypothetical protein
MSASNEPFIAKQDRPAVKLPNPDQPISELRVRDLQSILTGPIFKVRKEAFKMGRGLRSVVERGPGPTLL